VLISAASNSIVAKLHNLGECHLAPDGRNPISFCNIFFTGSVVAFFTLLISHPGELKAEKRKGFSKKDWILTIVSGALAGAIAPIMFFKALTETAVTNVVLVQTIEIPMVLALAWLMRGEKSTPTAILGATVAFAGVILTSVLGHEGPFHLMRGDVLTIAGTFSGVLATQLSRDVLQRMSPILYGIIRNGLGSILFAIIVLKFYGPAHFQDVFSPYLLDVDLGLRIHRGGGRTADVADGGKVGQGQRHCLGGGLHAGSRCFLRLFATGGKAGLGPVGRRCGDHGGSGVASVWGKEGAQAGKFGADLIDRVSGRLRLRG